MEGGGVTSACQVAGVGADEEVDAEEVVDQEYEDVGVEGHEASAKVHRTCTPAACQDMWDTASHVVSSRFKMRENARQRH